MPDALQAQADKLSRHAQSLFQPPALAWLEDIRHEISNPAVMLEQLLHEIIDQHHANEAPNSSVTTSRAKGGGIKVRSAQVPQTTSTNSYCRLTQPKTRVSRTGVNQARTKAFSPQQQAHSSASAQQQVPHARSLPGHTEVRPSAKASATHSSSSSTSSSQSTQLLTELGDLQNLLHAVAQEQLTDSSPTAAEHQQPTSKASANATTVPTDHTSWNDDLPFTESLSGVRLDETIKDPPRHQTSHNLSPTDNRQHTQTRTQTSEQDQSSFSTSEPPALSALIPHAVNPAGTGTVRNNPVINDAPVSTVPPEPSLPNTHTPPSAHVHTTHDEAATYAQVLSKLTTPDSAVQDLLLDQLLDRFEERQRENAMRALGFTGGQI